jgi:hypothetical protein
MIISFNNAIAGEADFSCDKKLSRGQCGRLLKAIRIWNNLFGRDVFIINSEYVGSIDSPKARTLAYELTDIKSLSQSKFPKIQREIMERNILITDSLHWMPKKFDDKTIEAKRVDIYRLMKNEKWKNDFNNWKGRLMHLINKGENNQVLQLEWQDRVGNKFKTTSVVSESYPYIYDHMLSNVAFANNISNCKYLQILWIWGSVRGEIIVELLPIYSSKKLVDCIESADSWMNFGEATAKVSKPEIKEDSCNVRYAYAWKTPFAEIEFDEKNFKFRISGLSSGGTGEGRCIKH